MPALRYRLALDLGSTSLGWAMIRLNAENQPCAVIKAGVRIFSDGRNPKDGSSLAVTRRDARSMRRRRDRLLKRKARMMRSLVEHNFFSSEEAERKALLTLNPYTLRAKGLDAALTPAEFGRALFHINQRRGFKSNRKTDKKDNDSGALKTAISTLRQTIAAYPIGLDGKPMKAEQFDLLAWVKRDLVESQNEKPRTVGEWLHKRDAAELTVRARYRQNKVIKDDGKTRIDKSYDLYIDRAMISDEFDALWRKQAELNPALFTEAARADLKDVLLHQRPLKPVKPGRCTFMPDEERAPLALPSTQRFRMYQEVNHLRILRPGLKEEALTLKQRDDLINALEANSKRTFTQIKKLLGIGGAVQFNFEDPKRQELKGNVTSAILSRAEHFGAAWFTFDETKQDEIVLQLVKEENEATLVRWLQEQTGINEGRAETIANAGLPEGYGSLCAKALARILPELRRDVLTYDKAVQAAGFDHHSNISAAATGEILMALPYYGQPLQRHVGFGTNDPKDSDEKRYGKIANPTVHIGLNQIRLVVNALIKRYGHPSEVIVEVARELKQSKDQRDDESKRQADNQRRNLRLRADIAGTLAISPERVRTADIQKMILWEELSSNIADRRCPYSGVQISATMLLSDQVEIEHILPFSETLDDSLNNKTVALRQANRVKGNRTPWDAFGTQPTAGFEYADMLARAELMPKSKRYRFGEDAMKQWLKDDAGFLPRALNDTRHMSKVAREYMSLVCPQNTRVIPGRMTAMLRAKFGLNDVLGVDGLKNRNDHRHHAVDACVIAVTDQGLLQRFAQASASAREQQLNRLVENMPLPWESYHEHVQRAISNIWVSHKPDHSHEGGMHEDTAYAPPHLSTAKQWNTRGIGGDKPNQKEATSKAMVAIKDAPDFTRHARDENGQPLPYKGYVGGSNFCIDIVKNDMGRWQGEVVSTFRVYDWLRSVGKEEGLTHLRTRARSMSNQPLKMRLQIGDMVKMKVENEERVMRAVSINSNNGQIFFAAHNEANVDARNKDKSDTFTYTSKLAGSLQKANGRRITISPIGELNDPGFKE